MDFSHSSAPSPSSLFAVVAVALIHRIRPGWLAIGVTEAAEAEGLNPERISRLATRMGGLWQAILDTHSHRGRPTHQPDQADELGLLRALLAMATTLLGQVNLGRPALRALVVGTWLRLHTELPQLTQQRFCETLALPTRTLRSWLHDAPCITQPLPQPSLSQPPKRSNKQRKSRRRRFGFDLVLPDTQIGADTTDLSVLGVPLKLVAAQDIGGRDSSLFEDTIVDAHENAQHVIDILTAAIAGREGMQVITDQGTPYMAKATREALEQLHAEHAPQREGNPTGKATVERGFGILKAIAAPLLTLSDRVAGIVPTLRDVELAKALGHLLIAALLRAYQAGSRATRLAVEQRGNVDADALARVTERARQDARAEEDSRRLLLSHLHEIYRFELSRDKFIHEYRRYPLPVLTHAEKQLRSQLHRNDILSLTRYFGAIVRNEMDAHRASKTRRDHFEQRANVARVDAETHANLRRARLADPVAWLREAIEGLVSQWLPREQQLLFGGVGVALGWMQAGTSQNRHRPRPHCPRRHRQRRHERLRPRSLRPSWATRSRRNSLASRTRDLGNRPTNSKFNLSLGSPARYPLEYRANQASTCSKSLADLNGRTLGITTRCGGAEGCRSQTDQSDTECRAKSEAACGSVAVEQYTYAKGCRCSDSEHSSPTCGNPSWWE